MNNLLIKAGMLVFFCLTFFISGCENNLISDSPAVNPKSSFFFLKTFDHQIIKQFKPALLLLAQKDLTNKHKDKQAERLSKTYNFDTGELYPEALVAANSVRQSRQAAGPPLNYFVEYRCPDGQGELHYTDQADVNNHISFGYVGAWIFAFKFLAPINNPFTYTSNYGGANSFCANASKQTGGWTGNKGFGEWLEASPTDLSKRFDAFWIYIGQNVGYFVFYRALLSNYEDTGWTVNGYTCGVPGSGKSLIEIELQFATYDVEP